MGQLLEMRVRLRRRVGMATLAAALCCGAVATSIETAGAAPVDAALQPQGVDLLASVAAQALADLQNYLVSSDSKTLAIYEHSRDNLAVDVAARLMIEPQRMIAAWDRADLTHQVALTAALTQLGVPYRRNASKPGVALDCSGLTTYAWAVAGEKLTRQSGAQIKAAAPRTQDTAMAGDLVYYPGHVMMYLGVDRAIVHAIQPGRPVEVDYVSKRRTPKFGNPIG